MDTKTNQELSMLIKKATVRDILGITPEAYRQRLSRYGRKRQFSFCRTYQSPERLKKMLRDFLNGPAFSTISEA